MLNQAFNHQKPLRNGTLYQSTRVVVLNATNNTSFLHHPQQPPPYLYQSRNLHFLRSYFLNKPKMSQQEPCIATQECQKMADGAQRREQPRKNPLFRVKKLTPNAILPTRGSNGAAGYDLSAAYDGVVPARGKALIKTDLSMAIAEDVYGRVAPRSGLAWKHSIDVGAGVIDSDYRGNIGVILFNHSDTEFPIKAGDRIAQLIFEKIQIVDFEEVDDLDATTRGEGGYGSTGQ